MLRSNIAWLIPLAFTLVGFEPNVQSATAQTTNNVYEFSIAYDVLAEFDTSFLPEKNIARVTVSGESIGVAPYGLTNFISDTYGQFDNRGNQIFSIFDANPRVFGIEGEILGDRYFGGDNELFGTASDSAEIDLVQNTIRGGGTITIFAGTGIFENATGIITFTQEDSITPGPTDGPLTSRGVAILNFSLQTPQRVPEPTATTTFVGIGVIGAGLLLRQRLLKATINY